MIKEFCDICENELSRNYVTKRLKIDVMGGRFDIEGKEKTVPRIRVEVMVGMGDTMNEGQICLECLKRILKQDI